MKYRHIVSVTGMSGLYQLLSTKSNGAFVKSLEDLSNKFISSRSHQVTPLESIEIYTTGDNIYLHEVLEKLKSVDAEIENLDYKDVNTFVQVFAKAVPEYDVDRVYNSDIRKILKWYGLLKKNNLLDFTEYFQAMAQMQENEQQESDNTAEEKPAKKASTKKASSKKSDEESAEEGEVEKPAKKAKSASKKAKTESTEELDTEKPAKKATTKKAATKKKED